MPLPNSTGTARHWPMGVPSFSSCTTLSAQLPPFDSSAKDDAQLRQPERTTTRAGMETIRVIAQLSLKLNPQDN